MSSEEIDRMYAQVERSKKLLEQIEAELARSQAAAKKGITLFKLKKGRPKDRK